MLERTVDIPDESGVIGYVDRYSACHLAFVQLHQLQDAVIVVVQVAGRSQAQLGGPTVFYSNDHYNKHTT